MFDSSQPIDIKIPSPAGDKHVTVGFPNDDQLADRVSKMKTVVRSIGRGKSITETQPNEQNDFQLFQAIKQSGDDLDEFEAAQVIARLVRCKVIDSVREGNQFIITLQVPEAKTVHTLKMPSAKQVQNYSRSVVSVIEGRHGLQEMKLNLRASAKLYDDLVDNTEGYAGPVPIPHKSEVISEVIALLNQDQEDGEIEGF